MHRYELLVAHSRDIILFIRRDDGLILEANAAAQAAYGYAAEELRGLTIQELWAPEARESLARQVAESDDRPVRFETVHRRKDGSTFPVEVSSEGTTEGGTRLLVSVVRDIAERRRAEESLRASERRYRRFFQNIREGAAINELVRDESGAIVDWRIVDANPEALRVLGMGLAELQGRLASDLYGPDAPGYIALSRRVMAEAPGAGRQTTFDTYMATTGRHYRAAAFALDEDTYVTTGIDITDQWNAERALRESEERLRALLEKSTDMIVVLDAGASFRFWSPSATESLGWSAEEMAGKNALDFVHPDDRLRVMEALQGLLQTPGVTSSIAGRFARKDGAWRQVEAFCRNCLADPAVRGVIVNSRDVTQQRSLEEQFQQAQKLESVGRLAGGVAHDFNNLLTVILSCTEALKHDLAAGRLPDPELVHDIAAAGESARDVTRQLLAFARRQVSHPVALDLNALVKASEKLLRRVLSEDVEVAVTLQPDAWGVRCDRGQLEQVIMNLAVNARDAMPGGGRLGIETANVQVDAGLIAAHPFLRAGPFVRLTVRDSGHGMTPEVKAHLFEPFFTTKPQGQGTGLGLATVYGIVKQSDGYILVDSEPGQGTAITILLPRLSDAAVEAAEPARATAARGSETILVVEDDPLVREVAVRSLRAGGYLVLAAGSARDALDLEPGELGRARLLITDVVMPGLDGHALAEELGRRHPDLRILYMSGYTPDAILDRGGLGTGIDFLPKPFTPSGLLARVRAILDGPSERSGSA
jgi:PAS domain S-box-containing protein